MIQTDVTYISLHSYVLQRTISNLVHRVYSAILSHSLFHPVAVRVVIFVSAAMNGGAFLSSEAIWIQLYDVIHPKCLDGLEQPCKDQEANWRSLSSLPLEMAWIIPASRYLCL